MKRFFTFIALSFFSFSAFAADKTWVGASGGDFSVSTNWSPSGAPGSTDKALFTSSTTVLFSSAVASLNGITLSSGVTVQLFTTGSTTINVGATIAPILVIPSDAKLELNATIASGTTGGIRLYVNTSTIDGTIESVSGSGSTIYTSGTVVFNGTVKQGTVNKAGTWADAGNITLNSGTIAFGANSVFELARSAGGTVPGATWNVSSTIKITGGQGASFAVSWNGSAMALGKFEFNCPAQAVRCYLQFGTSNPASFNGLTNFVNSNSQPIHLTSSTLSQASSPTFNENLTIATGVTIYTGSNANSLSAYFKIKKDLICNGTLGVDPANPGSSHTLEFNGTVAQNIKLNSVGSSTGKLIVTANNGTNGLNLASNITGLKEAKSTSNIILGNFNLSTATATGGGSGWCVTNGTGALTIVNVPTGGKNFPVGISTSSVDQIAITPAATADFTVSVKDASSGFTNAEADATKTCNREWNIVSSSSSALVEFKPDATSGCPGTVNVIGHYTSGAWVETANAGVGPFNGYPYSATFTSFSPFGTGQAGGFAVVLAVELKKVTAYGKGRNNMIEWSTANEKNMKEYIVERSTDGINAWEAISKQAAVNKLDANYSLEDATASTLSFYRVKSVELGGKEDMSKVVSVKRETKGKLNIARTYPNPSVDAVQIEFEATSNSKVTATVTDILGRAISTQQIQTVEGMNRMELNINALAKGMYVVTLQEGATVVTQRIVKQ